MGEKNDKQEEKNIKKEDVEKYKVLYEHCKSVSEQETVQYSILEEKAEKLFVIFNAMIVFLLVVGKMIFYTEYSNEFYDSSILIDYKWKMVTIITFFLSLYFNSRGIYFVLKALSVKQLKMPALREKNNYFFEKNDILDFYIKNIKYFIEIFETNHKRNKEKGEELKKSYEFLEKSYFFVLIFISMILIDLVI